MAYGLLGGVEPIYGLYSGIIPPIMAGLFASSAFMVVTLTSETALMTASLLESMGTVTMGVVFMFTILIGLWQLLFGYFKLGRYLSFISRSVMTGFITGLAVLIVLAQLGPFLGVHSEHYNHLLGAIDILLHPGSWDLATAFIGVAMIVLIILFRKTRLHKGSLVLSLISVSLINWIVGFSSVELIGDFTNIPRALPLPTLPDFAAIPELLLPSISTAILGVIIGFAVSQKYPNPDGDDPEPNRDFIGIGVANVVGGVFQSPPTTGSVSRTEVNIDAGAKSRLALLLSGIFMAALIMTVGPFAEFFPMSGLAGLLIFIGLEAINKQRLLRGWKTHSTGRIAMIITFILTLTIDLIWALLASIMFSFILYIYQLSLDVHVRKLERIDEWQFKEMEAPAKFASNKVNLVKIYGSGLFAAVATLIKKMPSIEGVRNAAIVTEMRGDKEENLTFFHWLRRYATKLHKSSNTIFLAEVEPELIDQLERLGVLQAIGKENIFLAQPVIGASFNDAIEAADNWVEKRTKHTPSK